MLDFNLSEMLVVAVIALVVIGPKDLPKAMRVVGHWVGRARGVARQFRSGFDAMVREAELEEMEKKWAAENERIMREHPMPAPEDDPHGADGVGSGYAPASGSGTSAPDIDAEREADRPADGWRESNRNARADDAGDAPATTVPRQ